MFKTIWGKVYRGSERLGALKSLLAFITFTGFQNYTRIQTKPQLLKKKIVGIQKIYEHSKSLKTFEKLIWVQKFPSLQNLTAFQDL